MTRRARLTLWDESLDGKLQRQQPRISRPPRFFQRILLRVEIIHSAPKGLIVTASSEVMAKEVVEAGAAVGTMAGEVIVGKRSQQIVPATSCLVLAVTALDD